MRFWDSSALVPLIVAEERSSAMAALLHEDSAIAAWWATSVECASAVRRVEREGALAAAAASDALAGLAELAASWAEVLPSTRIRDRAIRLLAVHPLRAADACQLAAALAWCEEDPRGADFVSPDARLAEAAGREGFDVVEG